MLKKAPSQMKMQHGSFLPSFLLRLSEFSANDLHFQLSHIITQETIKLEMFIQMGFALVPAILVDKAAVWDLFISKTIESKCNSVESKCNSLPYNWIKMQLRSFFNSQLFFTHPFTNVAWEIWMNCFWFSWWVGGIVFVGHFDVWGFRVGISRAQNKT